VLGALRGAFGNDLQRPDDARQPPMPRTATRDDDVDAALSAVEIAQMLPVLAAGLPYPPPRHRR